LYPKDSYIRLSLGDLDVESIEAEGRKRDNLKDPFKTKEQVMVTANIEDHLEIRKEKAAERYKQYQREKRHVEQLEQAALRSKKVEAVTRSMYKCIAMLAEAFLQETARETMDFFEDEQEFLSFVSGYTKQKVSITF
jgi:hypothetical protein